MQLSVEEDRYDRYIVQMDGLSFTTFLKLALMPSTQSKVCTLHRMMSSSDGYDFYKRMNLAGREVALDPSKADEVFTQLATIKKDAERSHNLLMAKRFLNWWLALQGAVALQERPKGNYKTAEMAFSVRLRPELMYEYEGKRLVTYLWATKFPSLTKQAAAAGLLMLRKSLAAAPHADIRFQILDLRKEILHGEELISNVTEDHLAADIALVNAIWISAKPLAA